MANITRFGGYTYDNRHADDELRTLRHENSALRAEVKRLRALVSNLEFAVALYRPIPSEHVGR